MKLISWNTNGIRACLNKGFMDFFKEIDPYLRNIILSSVFSSILGSYKQWINDGKKIPLQNFIDTMDYLIYTGIKNFNL